MMKFSICFVFLIALTRICNAAPATSMAQPYVDDNPGDLGYWVDTNDGCPFSDQDASNLVKSEIEKIHVIPTDEDVYARDTNFDALSRLYLSVKISCVYVTDGFYSVATNLNFGRSIISSKEHYFPMTFANYVPAVWFDRKNELLERLAKNVHLLLIDYVRANSK